MPLAVTQWELPGGTLALTTGAAHLQRPQGGTTVRHALLGASQSQAKSTDPGLQGQPQESRAGLGRLSGGVEAAP